MSRVSISCVVILAAIVGTPISVLACDTCGCTFNASGSDEAQTSGPMITTPTASTLGKGHRSVGFLFEHQRFNPHPAEDIKRLAGEGHDIHGKDHEEFYNVSVGYGILENLDLYLIAPVVSKATIEGEDQDRLGAKDHATGFGDLRLVGKYRFWQKGVDAALLMGVKAPTGASAKHKPSGDKFELEQQPGSGAWDLTTGLAVSRRLGAHASLASAFQYTTREEGGQEEKLGDVFHYDAGVSYALKPLGERPNLSVVLELHNEWARRDHNRNDDRALDSGGTVILLAPGLSAQLTDLLSAFWSMPIPIFQSLGGEHEKLKYEVISGLSWHF